MGDSRKHGLYIHYRDDLAVEMVRQNFSSGELSPFECDCAILLARRGIPPRLAANVLAMLRNLDPTGYNARTNQHRGWAESSFADITAAESIRRPVNVFKDPTNPCNSFTREELDRHVRATRQSVYAEVFSIAKAYDDAAAVEHCRVMYVTGEPPKTNGSAGS